MTDGSKECQEVKHPGWPNIDRPRYNQRYYINRVKHFFSITNPMNLFATSEDLENAKELISKFKRGEVLPENVTVDDVWRARDLYDSAYHPETGERMFILGRMSAQIPINMIILGAMLTYYKSTKSVIFWHWLNQSSTAITNYNNRSGDTKLNRAQIAATYIFGTGASLTTALSLNSMLRQYPTVIRRMVPFLSVAAGNSINITLMRVRELIEGVPIQDKYGHKLGCSVAAAKIGIVETIHSRNLMIVPPLVFIPVLMTHWEYTERLHRTTLLAAPIQILLVGLCLTFANPLCCALFDQHASLSIFDLEPEAQVMSVLRAPSNGRCLMLDASFIQCASNSCLCGVGILNQVKEFVRSIQHWREFEAS